MGTPHGRYLTIESPAKIVYYLVYPGLGKPPRNYSLIPSEEFRMLGTYLIPTDVKVRPFVQGGDTPEPVFSGPGKYRIKMGENLGSDYGYWSTDCTVLFLPK
jgi:hypothetical protein